MTLQPLPPASAELQQWEPPSGLPPAAAALVEWAQAAEAAHQLAVQLCATGFVPEAYRDQPALGTAAILAGSEIGLSPIGSLLSFDVIDGRPAPRALTLRAVLQRQGHEIIIDRLTDEICAGRGRRRGSSEWQKSEFTIRTARALGLASKRNWRLQPQAMLTARFTSQIARLIAADAVLGIPYVAEELEDQRDDTVTVPARRTVARRARPEPPEPSLTDDGPERPEQPPEQPLEPDAPEGNESQLDPITDPQMRLLHKLIRERFGDGRNQANRDAALMHISETLERRIDSTKDLSSREASIVIADLEIEPDPTDLGSEGAQPVDNYADPVDDTP